MRGAILIGGQSSRMGQAKHMLNKDGQPVISYFYSLLKEICGQDPVIVGLGEIPNQNWIRVEDRVVSAGPLSGLLGLMDYSTEDWLVLSSDVLGMDKSGLIWLIEQAKESDLDAIWPRYNHRKHGEPLAAIYRQTSKPILEMGWEKGIKSPCQTIDRENRFEPVIPKNHMFSFVNINTKKELDLLTKHQSGEELNLEEMECLFPYFGGHKVDS